MTEERRRILDMLSEGKISVDDAERLLGAMRAAGRVQTLEGPDESPYDEIEMGVRERVNVVLDRQDEAHTRDDTFEVGETPRLEVRGFNGRVCVESGEPGSIRVRAKLKNPRGVEYSAVQEGNLVKVEATPRHRSDHFLSGLFGHNTGVKIEVSVPADTSVDVVTSNGPVELRGTECGAALRTSNGPIKIERFKGDVSARTSNGPITVETLQGSADLTTSNGPVSIEDGHGRFDVTTSNGPIGFQGSMESGGRNRLVTSNGGIKMTLEAEPSLKLAASTVNGRVRCESPGFVASVDTGRELEGIVGEGEAELSAKTVNGLITIR